MNGMEFRFRRWSGIAIALFVLQFIALPVTASETAAFTGAMRRYFPKGTINTVLSSGENDSSVKRAYICVEQPEITGVRYERILLDLKDLRRHFVNDAVRIDGIASAAISGTLTKAEFERVIAAGFPSLKNIKITFSKKSIDILGVYEKSYLVRVRALMGFHGRYEIDSRTGTASLVFSDVTNDNAMVSAGEIVTVLEKACPKLDFNSLPGRPAVRHVVVDENRIWFSTVAR